MALSRTVPPVLMCALLLAGCGGDPPANSAQPSATVSATPTPTPTPSPTPAPSPVNVIVPAGVLAGIAVYDRESGTFVVQQRATQRFRSASLSKLLIVLDYLWNRGPAYSIPQADRARLDVMLRSSDDGAASYFWRLNGSGQIVTRMAGRLGLQDTAPPPAARPTAWGYTALSAADLVRVYRYLLESAPAPVRDFVMGNLRQATKCGTDRFDQSFGIPSAFGKPWSAKQGWSGFGDTPANPCTANAAFDGSGRAFVDVSRPRSAPLAEQAGSLDASRPRTAQLAATPTPSFAGEVLHTTGTVGASDRSIVAVLTLHPEGTSYAKATAALTALTRSLPVPGQ
jgi:hypothetical protein